MFRTMSGTYNNEHDDVANNHVLDHDDDDDVDDDGDDYDNDDDVRRLTIAMAAIYFSSYNQIFLTTTFLTLAFGSCFPQPHRQCYNTTCH